MSARSDAGRPSLVLESFVLEFNFSVKTPYLGVTFTYFASAFFFPERVINRKTASYDSLK